MPKVSVTIKAGRNQRNYEGDYAFVSLMNEDGNGNRWEQEPVGWKDGLGLFFCGMNALRTVAEQQGEEGFKEAARSAMDVLSLFDPASTDEDKKEKTKKLKSIIDKLGVSPKRGRKKKED